MRSQHFCIRWLNTSRSWWSSGNFWPRTAVRASVKSAHQHSVFKFLPRAQSSTLVNVAHGLTERESHHSWYLFCSFHPPFYRKVFHQTIGVNRWLPGYDHRSWSVRIELWSRNILRRIWKSPYCWGLGWKRASFRSASFYLKHIDCVRMQVLYSAIRSSS